MIAGSHYQRKIKGPLAFYWNKIEAYIKSFLYNSNWLASRALGEVKPEWESRIEKVCSSPENNFIKRVPDAGKISNGWITMHNGIQVSAMGYYGKGILNMLVRNLGVHEPEEERVFQEVLKYVQPGSTMIEAGSYWAFYSLWFSKEVKDAKCHMIESSYANILSGRKNFKKASKQGECFHAFVDNYTDLSKRRRATVTIDHYCKENNIQSLAILHADIQGAELNMLQGSINMLKKGCIDFIFISTHSNELHASCKQLMSKFDYEIIADIDLDTTCSCDGLLTYKNREIEFDKSSLH